jgi:peptidoglycan/LPS O-acetylase OafA/YrhL
VRHVPALDGLRGAAFAMVFWGHVDLLDGSGTSAVAMFVLFAPSGLLITALLVFGSHSWMTTVPDFHGPGGAEPLAVALEGVGAALAYVTNWLTIYHLESGYVPLGQLWSLAVEEQFYLIWAPAPVALLAVARRLPRPCSCSVSSPGRSLTDRGRSRAGS